MLEVTALALNNLKAYLEQNNVNSAIRVALMQGGCSGAALGLALDERKENDKSFDEDGLQFLIDKDLLEQCGSVKVDFIDAGYRSGFTITSTHPVSTGDSTGDDPCGSCKGSCG